MKLKLYGVDLSQPTRSVRWVLLGNGIPHEYIQTLPAFKGPGGTRDPEFIALNPNATVPVLVDEEDPAGTVVIWESGAILTYLARKYKLNALYPLDDTKMRVDIDCWLHWHHLNSRSFTTGIGLNKFRPKIKISKEQAEANARHAKVVAKLLEKVLSSRDFLAVGSTQATLADIIVYGDLGQSQEKWFKIYDFSPYPNLSKWLARMEKVKGFEEAHEMLNSFTSSKL